MRRILSLLIFVIMIGIAQADDNQIIDTVSIDLDDGAVLNILAPQNFTSISVYDSTEGANANFFRMLLNGSDIWLSSNTNKNISNLTYDTTTDIWSFNGSGTGGNLRINRTNAPYKNSYYILQVDGVTVATALSNASGDFGFTYSGWSEHTFTLLYINQFDKIVLTAATAGAAGNSITTNETVGNASFSASALTGGSDGSQWNSEVNPDMPSASGFWNTISSVMKVGGVIIIIGGFFSILRGGSDRNAAPEGYNYGYFVERPRRSMNMQGLTTMAVGVLTIIITFTIIPFVGAELDAGIDDAPGTVAASGELTFTGVVTDNELVNISGYTFEFNTDGTINPAYIPVNVSATGGLVNQSIAITNLTLAIQNNASISSILSVEAT